MAEPNPRAVDVHAHFLPPEAVESFGQPETLALRRGENGTTILVRGSPMHVPDGLVSQPVLVADMRARGLQQRWLAVPPPLFLYGLPQDQATAWARAFNDALIARARASGDTLIAIGTLPLGHPEAAKAELDRLAQLGVRGVQVASRTPNFELDDPGLDPVWATAADAGMVVLIHPHFIGGRYGDEAHHLRNLVGNPMETTWIAVRLAANGVLRRHRGARFVLSHGGGALPFLQGRIAHGASTRTNVANDLPAELLRFAFDTILFAPESLELLVLWAGAERVMYGTDYPFDMADPLGPAERLAALAPRDAQLIAGGTARRLLDDPEAKGVGAVPNAPTTA